jgi:hypothetical protein
VSSRCHLVYALAPPSVAAREANDLLNEYVADPSRGLAVWHDHFVGEHGGAVVLDVRDDGEEARLGDPGPLEGWQLSTHPLTFSLSAVGFSAQTEFTWSSTGTRASTSSRRPNPTILATGGGDPHDPARDVRT